MIERMGSGIALVASLIAISAITHNIVFFMYFRSEIGNLLTVSDHLSLAVRTVEFPFIAITGIAAILSAHFVYPLKILNPITKEKSLYVEDLVSIAIVILIIPLILMIPFEEFTSLKDVRILGTSFALFIMVFMFAVNRTLRKSVSNHENENNLVANLYFRYSVNLVAFAVASGSCSGLSSASSVRDGQVCIYTAELWQSKKSILLRPAMNIDRGMVAVRDDDKALILIPWSQISELSPALSNSYPQPC